MKQLRLGFVYGLGLAMLLLVTFAPRANASLIYYEGFNYSTGTLWNNNGGTGWGNNPWYDCNANTSIAVGSTSLGYNNNSLALSTVGNDATSFSNDNASHRRPGTFYGPPCNPGTYWLSFTAQRGSSVNLNGYAGMSLFDDGTGCDTGTEKLFIGKPGGSGNANWGFQPNGQAAQNTTTAIDGNPHFIVMKMVINGSSQWVLSMWVDPPLNTTEASIGTAGKTFTYSNNNCWDRVRLAAGGGYSMNFDEIRWGTSYFDVSPLAAPTVSIVANQTYPICTNNTLTFTATPSNAGTSPTYTWYTNSIAVAGQTTSTLTLNPGSYKNNDTVLATVTQNVGSSGRTAQTSANSSTVTITTSTTPFITTTTLPNVSINVAYNQTVQATGSSGYTWTISAGSLPSGLSINSSSGAITGTYTGGTGSSTFTVRCTESAHSCFTEKQYTVNMVNCSAITVSGTPPAGTVAASYAGVTFTSSGGTGPYTYTISVNSLPPGLSMSSGGAVSGAPTHSGTYNFTVLANDSAGCPGTLATSITVSCPTLTLTPAAGALTAGTVGTAYSQSFSASGGINSYTYALANSNLPGTLTLSSGGVLSGTPTSSGSYSFDVTATDSSGCTKTQSYTLQINCPTITVAPATLPNLVASATSYTTNVSATATGLSGFSFTISAGALPTGLTMTTGGVISGTPSAAGSYSFTVQATASGCSGTTAYTVVVGTAASVTTSPTAQAACSGSSATFTVTGGGTAALSYQWQKVGTGWSANSWTFTGGHYIGNSTGNDNGETSCTSFSPTGHDIDTADGRSFGMYGPGAVATRQFTALTAGQVVSIDMDNGSVDGGAKNGFILQTSGGTDVIRFYFLGGGTYRYFDTVEHDTGLAFTREGLRVQIILNSSTQYTLVVRRCLDSAPLQFIGTYSGTIAQLKLSNNNAAGGGIADLFFNNIIIGGFSDNAGNYTAGNPGGWTGTGNGQGPISGATSASYGVVGSNNDQYQAIVYNAYGTALSASALLTVNANPTVTTTTLPNAAQGASYNQTLVATGGTSPYTWTLTGSLPTGLTMSSGGVISGIPTVPGGPTTFSVTATDNTSTHCISASQSLSITVIACPTITISGTLPNGTVAASYGSQTLTGGGGTGPYTFTVDSGSLPAGLTLSSGGVVSGTPTSSASVSFTLRATDANSCYGTQSYTVTPACPTITLSPAAGALTAGTVGTAYSQTFSASGANGSFTYSKTSGTLPTGLSLSSGGVLSGTPTASGNYSFDVTATDSSGCTKTQSYTLQMICPTITVSLLSVNNSTLPFGVSNLLYSVTNNIFTASGSPATPYTFSSTTLPAGLSLSSAGALSGTPTTTNTVSFTVTATDTNNCTGTANYTITNGWAVAITAQPTNITVCSGSTANFTVAATGTGPLSYLWRKNNVGWGTGNAWTFVTTACNGTHGYYLGDSTACGGINPGIGTAYGLYANSGDNAEVTRNFGDLQIGQSVVIDYQNPRDMDSSGAKTLPLFALRDSSGVARFEFYFFGGDAQYTINDANPLPNNSGITYTPNGLQLVFTLVSADTYNLQVYRKSGSGNYTYVNRTLKGTAGNAISQIRFFYRNTGAGGTACQDFFFNVVSVGGYNDLAANYSTGGCGSTDWTNNSNKGQGPLTDTGNVSGSTTPTLQLSNVSNSDTGTYSVVVYNGYGALKSGTATLNANTSPSITTATPLPNGTVGTSYSKTIVATGGLTPYTWSISGGTLPAGLSIGSSSGVISGVPTTAGTSAFTVSVSDNSTTHCAGSSNMTIAVNCPTITVAPTSLPNGTLDHSYNQTITASGGNTPYTFAVTSGNLPDGLTMDSDGAISGTTTTLGTYNFTVTATDANGCTNNRNYTVQVLSCPAITIDQASLPGGTTGTGYSQTITTSGGTGPYTYSVTIGSLPAGLSLSSGGVVSGTPTAAGSSTFTVQSTDTATSCGVTKQFTIIIGCPSITVSPSSLSGGTVGTAYSQTISASGGAGGYTYSKTAGTLPGGLTLSSAGLLSGTPNAAGTFNFTVQAADTYGCTGSNNAYSVVIGCTGTALSPSSLPGGTAGVAYSQTITFTGGTSPYSFSLASGTLPTGLTVSSAGVISGTPSAAGSYTFTVSGTDGANCTASQQYTVSICGPPAVSSQPANTNVCSGSSASFTVTASGTSPLHYVWRKRTTGWGTGNGWTFAPGGGGFFMSSSAGNGGGSSGNINSSNNKAWGMYNDGGAATEAFRPIPGGLAVGETFAIDMDNGYINNAGYAGFGLRNASDENVLEFYFIGGQPAYKINGLTEQNTGIGHTVNGLHIEITLTSATAYSVAVTPAGSGTQTFTGTLLNPAGGRAITKLRMFNINANANNGSDYDVYFNNISVGCYDDDAGNYANWVTDGDKGNGPISGAADSASYTISTASAGDAGSYDVCVTNACGITTSDPATLSVTTVDAAGAITGSATVCAGQSGVTYSIGAVTGATSYDWTVPTDATITAGGSGPNNTQITVTFGTASGSVGVTPRNGSCSGTAASTAVTVVSVDVAGAITGSTSVCPSQSGVTYSISAVTGATSYDWTVPTGATITAGGSGPNNTQITVTFGSNSGSVGVTPKNGSCSGTPSSLAVTVSANPTVTASSDAPFFGGAYQIVQGQTLHLSASGVGGATAYNWSRSGGGFSPSGQSVSDTPTAGSYTYTVTVPTSCGTAVNSTPTIVVLATTDGTIPDNWKTAHGYSSSKPASDTGANGMTLLQSYLAGVDPTNTVGDRLKIATISVTPAGMVTVDWNSKQDGTTPQRLYDVYYHTGSFSNGISWTLALANEAPQGATSGIIDDVSAANITQRFYRVTIAGHTNDVATPEIVGVDALHLVEGANYVSLSMLPGTNTLLSVLGTNQLPQGATENTATTVDIWDQNNQVPGATYWLATGINGWLHHGNNAPSNGVLLDPNKGLAITIRAGQGSQTLRIVGFVPTANEIQVVQGANGYTVASSTFPTPIALNATGGGDGSGLVASGFLGGISISRSDNLLFFNPATQLFDIRIWYATGTGADNKWHNADGSVTTRKLQPGEAFLIQRSTFSGHAGNITWTNTVPYTTVPQLQGP